MNRWPFPVPLRLNLHIPLHSTAKHWAQWCALFGRMTRGWADSGVSGTRGLRGCTDIPLCVCGLLYGCAGAWLSRGRLWAALHPTFSCVTVLYKDLCAWGTVQEIIWIFCIFSSLNVCMCVRSHLCVWESEWGLCVCFLFVYIPPLYEKAKATNVICILCYGHPWVSGRSGW